MSSKSFARRKAAVFKEIDPPRSRVLVSIRASNNLSRAKLTRFSTILEVIVITGFNTDIEHNGTVYHVQTEDKGLETPLILSLVYVGGAILASKRAPYDDLLAAGFDQTVLGERLQRQHKLICAAVNAGRIEDLKRMSQREPSQPPGHAATPRADGPIGIEETSTTIAAVESTAIFAHDKTSPTEPQTISLATETRAATADRELFITTFDSDPHIKVEPDLLVATVEGTRNDSHLESPQAGGTLVAAAADVAQALHERIEEQATEVVPVEIDDALHVELLGEKDYHAGEMVTLRVAVLRGAFGFREIVRDANVTVKVLGTEFRPLILTSKTDADGLAVVHVWLPRFKLGRAAILVRAHSDDCSAELRRVIHHN
ncbi:MAG: hypothetical protein QOE33_1637 [Acidobacteriota bacterium]|nr:hypothetical protein [Acidobacteriota bacterium]